MTDITEAPVRTDAELRTLWQQAGGTIYSSNSEIGSMPTRKLMPFLRRLLGPAVALVTGGLSDTMPQSGAEALGHAVTLEAGPEPDTTYARALMALVAAVCPGLDTGNLFEDARKATEAMLAGSELAGHFGIDDEPCGDGSARYVQVGAQFARDADVFPLYRRAERAGVVTLDIVVSGSPAAEAAPAAAPAPRAPATKKAKAGQGGAA